MSTVDVRKQASKHIIHMNTRAYRAPIIVRSYRYT